MVCLAALAAAVVPWTVTTTFATSQIARHVKAATGLDLEIDGRATIALLPVPRIKLETVALKGSDGAEVARAAQLRGELKLLPLMTGGVVLADATLLQPTFILAPGDHGGTLRDAVLRHLNDDAGAAPAIGRLIVVDGRIERRAAQPGDSPIADDVNLVVDWPAPASDANLVGTFVWRGQTVEARIDGLSPAKLQAGKASKLSLRLKSPAATLALTGEVNGTSDPQVTGRISFASTALGQFEHWLDAGVPLAPLVQRLTLDGPVIVSSRGLSMNAATVTLGADALEGALTARVENGRMSVSGTFAAETLDLTPFIQPFVLARGGEGGWSGDKIATRMLTNADLDLRLSANAARVGRFRLDALAGGILLKSGRLEISLGRADVYRGGLKGRLGIAATAFGVDARLQGSFERVDMLAALGDAFDLKRISGTGSGQVALEASGGSFAELARNLSGKANVGVKQGEIAGLDLAGAVRRTGSRPLSGPIDWRGGRTPFDQLNATLAVSNGVAEVLEGTLATSLLQATLGGRVHVAERAFAVQGNLRGVQAGISPAAAGPADGPAGLPFEIVGNWDDPAIRPDVRSLIQRSGTATPLLDTRRTVPDSIMSLDVLPR